MGLQHKINTLTIRTPEGIEFSLLLAGPVTRFFAWSVDLLAILAISKLLNVALVLIGIALVGISAFFPSARQLVEEWLVECHQALALGALCNSFD